MKQIEHLSNWWGTRNLREKWILKIGGVFLTILLLYVAIFQPIHHKINMLSENLSAQKQTLAWMQSEIPALKSLRQGNPSRQNIPPGSLLSILEKSLKQSPLAKEIVELQKNPDETQESVQLKFNHINFDELTKWLINFSNTYGITIVQFSATRTSENGIVQANLVIAVSKI